jgi:hypothetical protein
MSKALIAAAAIFVIGLIGLIVYLANSATNTAVSNITDITSSQLSSPTVDTSSSPTLGTSSPPPADASVITPVSSSDTLSTGGILNSNNSTTGNTMLTSQNGQYVMILLKDGNLVIFDKTTWKTVWSTSTGSSTRTGILKLAMQNDGNLVIYDSAGAPVWASNTAGKGNNLSLKLNNDGTAMIVDANNALVWLTAPKNIRMVLTKANAFALDSTGNSANGISPWFYGNNPANTNQTFVYDLGSNAIKWNGKCLDIPNSNAVNGQTVQWWDCNNANAQKWTYDPTTLLWKSALNNKCLDSTGNAGLHNEVKPTVFDCSATNENQMWNAPW